jgi:hypothetical protein
MILQTQGHCPGEIFAWPTQITSNKPSPAIVPLCLCTNRGRVLIRIQTKFSIVFQIKIFVKNLAFFMLEAAVLSRKMSSRFFTFVILSGTGSGIHSVPVLLRQKVKVPAVPVPVPQQHE